jgi:hypothetical protein
MNAAERVRRRAELRRIDAWWNEFCRTSPVLFTIFCIGLAMFLGAGLIVILEAIR